MNYQILTGVWSARNRVIIACFLLGVGAFITQAANARQPIFARWAINSSSIPNSETLVEQREFVEAGWLQPQAAIKTSDAIYDKEKNRVILPAGAILVQMGGGSPPQFCTWNHGSHFISDEARAGLSLISGGALLCVSLNPDNTTKNLNYLSSTRALLLGVYKFDFAGGARDTNSVATTAARPEAYYQDVKFGPIVVLDKNGVKYPCLQWAGQVNGSSEKIEFGENQCFKSSELSIDYDGAIYELIRFDSVSAAIRVKKPFSFPDISLKIIQW